MQAVYCDCGEMLDQDCNGNMRCIECDGPCPCCYDGGMDAQEDECDDECECGECDECSERLWSEWEAEHFGNVPADVY